VELTDSISHHEPIASFHGSFVHEQYEQYKTASFDDDDIVHARDKTKHGRTQYYPVLVIWSVDKLSACT